MLAPTPALAFKVQVDDGTADEPGHAGIELHLNRAKTGTFNATPLGFAAKRKRSASRTIGRISSQSLIFKMVLGYAF